MGVFPEPAHRADDVSRLVPNETVCNTGTAAWLPRKRRIASSVPLRGTFAKLLLGLVIGSALPQSALAPAASAHDRIDEQAITATAWASASLKPDEWSGIPIVEQEPATLALIEDDLAGLPQARDEQGRETLHFGDTTVPREIVDTILRAAGETGVDPVYMMALADKESRFSTTVKASTSSAEGLFQFLSGTWLEMIRSYGARYGLATEAAAVTGRGGAITIPDEALRGRVLRLRQDPYVAALMAAELVKRDRGRIEQRIGRDLKTSELYFAHFLGTASAGRLLTLSTQKPEQLAKSVFRAAARANRSLFSEKKGNGRRSLTVAEVRDRIDGMIDRRLIRYEGVVALASDQDARHPEPAPASTEPGLKRILVTDATPPADR